MTPHSRTLSGLLGTVFGLISVSSGFAMTSRPPTVKTGHGIPYVSGGVSVDDRLALRQMTHDDNVQLIFAAKNRDYLSDVSVRITDGKGHQVLNSVAQGPWLFTKLPAGKYTITATTMGHSQGTVAEVTPTGQTRVYLTWENSVVKPVHQSVAQR
ncbi:MAG: hypothetical protein AB7P69_21395 [Candidatus Binatia bacterium]